MTETSLSQFVLEFCKRHHLDPKKPAFKRKANGTIGDETAESILMGQLIVAEYQESLKSSVSSETKTGENHN